MIKWVRGKGRWVFVVVEGGSGLLDSVLKVQCLHLVLPELVLVSEHVGCLGLDVLEGGEGDVSSDLLLCIGLLTHCSLSEHLHGDLLRLGVVVLDVLENVLDWAECRRRSPQSQSQLAR